MGEESKAEIPFIMLRTVAGFMDFGTPSPPNQLSLSMEAEMCVFVLISASHLVDACMNQSNPVV